MSKFEGLIINDWSIFAHPIFLDQVEVLIKEVENFCQKDPIGFKNKNCTKRLAAISKLIFEVIPADPTRPEYRQGRTLGLEYTHWYRAKFFQQYRLFFRYHLENKVIIFAWVNDDITKRAYGSKRDAYLTFSKMLNKGCPPDSWSELLLESKNKDGQKRTMDLVNT